MVELQIISEHKNMKFSSLGRVQLRYAQRICLYSSRSSLLYFWLLYMRFSISPFYLRLFKIVSFSLSQLPVPYQLSSVYVDP